jgi:hypothetical protein
MAAGNPIDACDHRRVRSVFRKITVARVNPGSTAFKGGWILETLVLSGSWQLRLIRGERRASERQCNARH